MLLRCIAICSLTFFPSPQLYAQNTGKDSFGETVKDAQRRMEMYNTNKKITGSGKIYAVEVNAGVYSSKLLDDWDFELIRDNQGNFRRITTGCRVDARRVGTGCYSTPKIFYFISKKDDQYYVNDFISMADSQEHFIDRITGGPDWTVSSFDGNRSIESIAIMLKGNSRATHAFSLGSSSRVNKFDRDVVAIQSRFTPKPELAGRGFTTIQQTSYFDPNRSYIFLGAESSENATKDRPYSMKAYYELEYHPAVDGRYPLPKRFTQHVQPEKSAKILTKEIVYNSYEDFVPDPEEFRLEKRYGLTTPVHSEDKPKPGSRPMGSPFRIGFWALFVLVGIVLAYRYYRPQSKKSSPQKA